MIRKVHAIALCATTISFANPTLADTCYTVSGSVTTENVTDTLQIGTIDLTLQDAGGNIAFSDQGELVGNVTGTDGFGATILSHRAKFPRRNSFVTSGDRAELAPPYVRATLDDGVTPCSFWIHETISNIVEGRRFFRNVSSVQVFADGYVSSCPGENQNQFELSGELCKERRRDDHDDDRD